MLSRRDSPWYPTMKLFRQDRWNGWDGVFDRVAEELRLVVKGHNSPSLLRAEQSRISK